MSNLNKFIIILGILTITGLLYRAYTPENHADINAQQQKKKGEFLDANKGAEDSSLNNTKQTLNTLLAEKRRSEKELGLLTGEVARLTSKLDQMERAKTDNAEPLEDSVDFLLMKQTIEDLQADLNNMKDQQKEQSSKPGKTEVSDNSLVPIEVTDLNGETDTEIKSSNSIIDFLVPAGEQPAPLGSADSANGAIKSKRPERIYVDGSDGLVWMDQDDLLVTVDKDGNQVKTYPVPVSANKSPLAVNEIMYDDLGNPLDAGQGVTEKINPEIPIYTIPQNSTLFGAVGMSAIIGRVPIKNQLSNPFDFKVIVGPENLASNDFFMPHLEKMTVAGFAEGDFTLECARGKVMSATFTFVDGTVREISAENSDKPLGWISDEYGVPCISGEYITNFPEYATKQGLLKTMGGFFSALANSAVTTSTSSEGVTTQVVNDSVKNAAGKGLEQGSKEVSDWYADRQESAFDAVFIPTGEKVVVNIETALHIDYEPNGRKLIHEENVKEYLGW